jgi:hypothetical protein
MFEAMGRTSSSDVPRHSARIIDIDAGGAGLQSSAKQTRLFRDLDLFPEDGSLDSSESELRDDCSDRGLGSPQAKRAPAPIKVLS